MGSKCVIVISLLFGIASANVTMSAIWKPNLGWDIKCSWQIGINDTLYGVMLFRNGQLFMSFRPQQHGQQYERYNSSQEFILSTTCRSSVHAGQRGECVVSMTPLREPKEDVYECLVTGERPQFREEKQTYVPHVAPSDAHIERTLKTGDDVSTQESLNCTSSGWPAPKLKWEMNGEPVPEDFTHSVWNDTTKLWQSWSSYTPQQSVTGARCTPVATTRDKLSLEGKTDQYNSAGYCGLSATLLLLTPIVLMR